MSQDTNELDWNDYGDGKGYGSFGNDQMKSDENEFQNIKINLNDHKSNSTGGEYDKGAKKEDLKYGELRKSNVSTSDDKEAQKGDIPQDELLKRANRCCNCLHLDYYQEYFDVTTQEVLQRCLFSLIPVGDKLVQVIGEKPDMYGPFWLYTTLLFLLAFSENLHNYIAVGYDEFQYDFQNIFPSFFTVYGVGFGVPIAISFAMKYISNTELKFKEITCIYGYSFTSICI
jgi:hypothetical protein